MLRPSTTWSAFFRLDAGKFMKSIIYLADGAPVMAVIAGNREINEHKLKGHLGAASLELAMDSAVEETTGAPVGFAGPVNKFKLRTVCDIGSEGHRQRNYRGQQK